MERKVFIDRQMFSIFAANENEREEQMKRYAIIVAGGKGLRMNADLPKQFLPIGGVPILMRTLETFHHFDPLIQLIVVLPQSQQDYWKSLCQQHQFCIAHSVANGGATRFNSVKNGLELIDNSEDSLVAVHDGVRPFASDTTLRQAYEGAERCAAAIPVIDSVDSIRQTSANGSKAIDRSSIKLVQTPQVFRCKVLKKAYLQDFDPTFTDDASVVEKAGYTVQLTQGNRENIKITTPFDLMVAEALAKSQK